MNRNAIAGGLLALSQLLNSGPCAAGGDLQEYAYYVTGLKVEIIADANNITSGAKTDHGRWEARRRGIIAPPAGCRFLHPATTPIWNSRVTHVDGGDDGTSNGTIRYRLPAEYETGGLVIETATSGESQSKGWYRYWRSITNIKLNGDQRPRLMCTTPQGSTVMLPRGRTGGKTELYGGANGYNGWWNVADKVDKGELTLVRAAEPTPVAVLTDVTISEKGKYYSIGEIKVPGDAVLGLVELSAEGATDEIMLRIGSEEGIRRVTTMLMPDAELAMFAKVVSAEPGRRENKVVLRVEVR